jgi:uncharacterized repeat protein (TIGR01451 family)
MRGPILAFLAIVLVLFQPRQQADPGIISTDASADLLISMNAELDPITPQENIIYTIDVANGGPDDADGAVLKDRPGAGLELTDVTCSSDWTEAICPIQGNTIIELVGDGIVIPKLPNGGSLTFRVSGRATISGGFLENFAKITPPEGIIDPVANNSIWLWVYLVGSTFFHYLPFIH